jgi:hypothetical protein
LRKKAWRLKIVLSLRPLPFFIKQQTKQQQENRQRPPSLLPSLKSGNHPTCRSALLALVLLLPPWFRSKSCILPHSKFLCQQCLILVPAFEFCCIYYLRVYLDSNLARRTKAGSSCPCPWKRYVRTYMMLAFAFSSSNWVVGK